LDWDGRGNGERFIGEAAGEENMRKGSMDWRGGKVLYREWSKLGVERTLGALNGEGSWEELAPEYWKTSRRVTHSLQKKPQRVGHPRKKQSQNQLGVLVKGRPPAGLPANRRSKGQQDAVA